MSHKRERKKKHGLSGTPFYRTWTNMKSRCLYPKDKKFQYYGGRGITICDNWFDFTSFMDDMYISYLEHKVNHKTTTIERLDNNSNYCSENCCWATREKQQINKKHYCPVANAKQITILITDDQHERLKDRTKSFNIPMAEQIRAAIDTYCSF